MDSTTSRYENISASGSSQQVNGNIINDYRDAIFQVGSAAGRDCKKANENRYFATQIRVDTYYTGRNHEAEHLAKLFLPSSQPGSHSPRQARFVICGTGGSGKTQFCCKFAEHNRNHFWGIFWVDGRSHGDFKQSYSQNVAKVAGVDLNVAAALRWLTDLETEKPWLLIVDNADDPSIDLQEYLPSGNRGHILITTRYNPHRALGNVGQGSFIFHELLHEEAEHLLLSAAGQSQPYDTIVIKTATRISHALGYLALAIAVAGASIRSNYCSFNEYLRYYDIQRQKDRKRTRAQMEEANHTRSSKYKSAEAAFDVTYEAIASRATAKDQDAQDALNVLKVLANMHCENARFEFFLRAMTNAADVRLQATSAPPQTWPQWFTPDIVKIYTYFAHRWQRPPLPAVFTTLQEDYTPDFFRLKAALSQLSQSSLVIHNSATNAYSMHPLVHTWAREVPGISTVEKARWAECAATLIADCISLSTPEDAVRLPEPGEDEGQIAQRDQRRQRQQEEQEDLRRYLLPHVDHVRGQQRAIELELKTERDEMQKNWLLKHWPVMERGFSRERALMFAKFSVVYAEHARWEDARDLQIMVKDFTMKYLGIGHASTRRISLFLAETYIHLSQPDLAEELQVKVVNACVSKHDKLIAQQRLAESRRLQGFLTHSRELLEEAVDGLTELLGETHEDTLNAVDFLGRTLVMYHDDKLYTVARTLHRKAYDGIRKIHGRNSLKALLAGENLSVTAVCTHEPEHLREAHDMMIHILETRKEKLGREHAYTLLATVNLARVKAEMGFLSDAEGLIEYGLPIAKRNLGADHIAYLWGRYELAKVMTKQERWEASEALLKDNIVRQKQVFEKRGGHHPDVIGGLIEYATVLNALERYEDCERIVEEALESLAKLSTTSVDHPLASKLKASCARWRQTRGT